MASTTARRCSGWLMVACIVGNQQKNGVYLIIDYFVFSSLISHGYMVARLIDGVKYWYVIRKLIQKKNQIITGFVIDY